MFEDKKNKTLLTWHEIDKISYARTQKGWSQKQLAEKVGVSQKTISNIEIFRYESVDSSILKEVKKVLKVK